jgi:alpha-tubulin suppressor-like RCC1 family protein
MYSTYAIKTDGTLWVWGLGTSGQLGNSAAVDYSSPVQVGGLTTWSKVAGARYTGLATTTAGTLYAWGSNAYGQLAQGTSGTANSSPVQIGALTTWNVISKNIQSQSILVTTKG